MSELRAWDSRSELVEQLRRHAPLGVLDLASLAVTYVDLVGPFFEFVPIDLGGDVLALHELGVVRLGPDGRERWRAEADDIVTGWKLDAGGRLVLMRYDTPVELRISLESGRCV